MTAPSFRANGKLTQRDRDASGELWMTINGDPPSPHDGVAAEQLETVAYAFADHRIETEQDLAAWLDARADRCRSRWGARLYRIIADDLRARLHED